MVKEIFINLAVKDLEKSKRFFHHLGFTFNKQFTDQNAACLILGKDMYVMLLLEKFFKSFTPALDLVDTTKAVEVINAFSVASRKEVDDMIKKVTEAGGREYRQVSDYGWMYSRSFHDVDGHIWEVLHADESKLPKEMMDKK